ncbi:YbhB/YbcL family Raf kinase inhibitor-like protein [Streptomyces sp. NPDC057616]|uniref:YbhB/YbcL family Raf kinase inhibitor-like protein n=1 Tax=Streptomyces sp. NPDC057616 TaxID=3346183 RepID=UPI00369C99EC
MRRRLVIVAASAAVGLISGCGGDGGDTSAPPPSASQRITVSSPAFADGGTIPRRYTCDGGNVSPPLSFSGLPSGSKGLAVLVEDPDAPHGTFVHWVVWNAPPSQGGWTTGQVPRGAEQGRNGFRKNGYGGPCPPKGQRHRYVFSAYAADRVLHLASGASADAVKRALTGHALASGHLTGRYGR